MLRALLGQLRRLPRRYRLHVGVSLRYSKFLFHVFHCIHIPPALGRLKSRSSVGWVYEERSHGWSRSSVVKMRDSTSLKAPATSETMSQKDAPRDTGSLNAAVLT